MPRGLRHSARSISFLSPMSSCPDAFLVRKIASLILRPECWFRDLISFQSRRRPTFSRGSSSLSSRRRQLLSSSRVRFRPPGNIHSRSRRRRTSNTLPPLFATSFEDFAIRPGALHDSSEILFFLASNRKNEGGSRVNETLSPALCRRLR